MNYLDIFLWVSAIGLWFWVMIEIGVFILKFKDKVNDAKNKAYWARELLESHRSVSDTRYYEIIDRLEKLEGKKRK